MSEPAWRDEHPDRHGPINPDDYVPYGVGEHKHFVQAQWKPGWFGVADKTACGLRVPDDWKQNPKAHPICGIVDCEACLAAMKAATGAA